MTQRLLLMSQLAALCAAPAAVVGAQQRDTTARPADSLRVHTLPPAVVSVTRGNPPINRIPQAVQLVDKTEISRQRVQPVLRGVGGYQRGAGALF